MAITLSGTSSSAAYLGLLGTITNAPDLRTGTYTMACRVRWTTTSTTLDMLNVSLQNSANARGFYMQRANGGASTALEAYRFNGSFSFNTATFTGGYGSTTAWVHIATTYDGSTIRTYVNGVAGATASSTSTFLAAGAPNVISIAGPASCETCDVALFARALTAAEIVLLANERLPLIGHGDCFGWYPMIGASVADCGIDCSGSGNHCTVQQSGTGDPVVSTGMSGTTWGGGPQSIHFLRPAPPLAIVPSGTTQTTGSAVVAGALIPSGTTNTTGSANVVASLTAVGTTQSTGAAAVVPQLTATGTTQTSGAADAPQALSTGLTTIPNIVGGWAFVSASASGQKLFWMGSASADFMQIAVDGTTITYELVSTADGSHYLYQTTISLNTWFHVAFQKAASVCTSYLNGAVVDSASVTFSHLSLAGPLLLQKNLSGTMRHAFKSNSGLYDVSVTNAMNSVATLMSAANPFGVFIWPMLPGGGRLKGVGFLGGFDLTVLGVVPEVDENPPANWSGQSALWFATTGALPIPAAGTTNTTGAASMVPQLAAVGATTTTGAVAVAAQLTAAGTTNATGAAAVAAVVSAVGATQTSGAALVANVIAASGTTSSTGAALLAVQFVATGTTQSSGASTMSANGLQYITATGTTTSTGAAAEGYTQTMLAAGTTQTAGLGAIGIGYAMVAIGATQTTGAAAMFIPLPSAGGDGAQTGSDRRWSPAGSMRRRTRR